MSMSQFNLDKVLSVIPYMPDISGILDGDFHIIQTKDELSVSSNLNIDNMVYESVRWEMSVLNSFTCQRATVLIM